MTGFQNQNGRPILLGMVRAIQENKAYLGEVDGLIGDGDHGMNKNKGFTLYAEQLGDEDVSFTQGLNDLGLILFNRIGGSMGPIYGTIFMDMADAAEDAETIDLPCLTKMMEAGLTGLYEIVEARPGDKSLVDTLAPAVAALQTAQADPFADALGKMADAAERGWQSTKDLAAKYGRAARLGERSRGVLDAGATSCYILLRAMAEGMLAELDAEKV